MMEAGDAGPREIRFDERPFQVLARLEGECPTRCVKHAQVAVRIRLPGGELGMCDGIDLVGESGFDREWHVDGTSGHRSWRGCRISASHQGGRRLGVLRRQELGLLKHAT